MSAELLLKLAILSDPSVLCVVRGAVERLTETFGFTPPECRAITRAVDEALTNIMRHSYGGRVDRPIEMQIRRIPGRRTADGGDGLEILLLDRGPAINPAKLRGRQLDDIKPGGLGLHFIRQSMDTVVFKRIGKANQLRLVKYLQMPKGV
jgi:anti-sigma regulatory factor (Ser/Thr protein kinase)